MRWFFGLASLVALVLVQPGAAQEEARLLRFPTIHGNQIVFTYAGDLYTVAATGGIARRLTSHDGFEMFPRFSPDGKWIAFTGPVRRQHRNLRDAAPRAARRSASPTRARSAATTSPTAWGRTTSSWAGRTTASTSSSARACSSFNDFIGQLYTVAARRRPARATAAAARRLLLVFARRQEARLQPRLPRVPHLETLSRRHGRRRLDLRLRDEEDRESHQRPGPGHHPDVGTATRSTSSPTATTASA